MNCAMLITTAECHSRTQSHILEALFAAAFHVVQAGYAHMREWAQQGWAGTTEDFDYFQMAVRLADRALDALSYAACAACGGFPHSTRAAVVVRHMFK